MKIGLLTIGMGNAARPGAIAEVARHAERLGIATLWAPEHVVLFDSHQSKYPYSASGKFPLAATVDTFISFVSSPSSRFALNCTALFLAGSIAPAAWNVVCPNATRAV